MENKTKYVSMFEITKMAFEGKNDFERQINYELWLKNKNNMENIIMDEINKKISFQIDKKIIENSTIDIEKSIKETAEKMRNIIRNQEKENFIDLPLKVYQNTWNNELSLTSFRNYEHLKEFHQEEDETLFNLYLSTDTDTGKLSIQYRGENGSFLNHKEVIKAIKKENKVGKHWRI